jgi:N-acylneuraminate cytidylyltransferase
MIDGLSCLALITARGGSKGLPGKNVRPVNGRPLIDFTVSVARAARCVDRVVLSTDDLTIAAIAAAGGCDVPFIRPSALADDTACTIDVVLHAMDQLPPFDVVVLLQPTSPARSVDDIEACCRRVGQGAPACVSVMLAEQSPYWMMRCQRQRVAKIFRLSTSLTGLCTLHAHLFYANIRASPQRVLWGT